MYVQLFKSPLSDEHIRDLLALFGWEASALPLVDVPQEVAGAL